MLTLSYLKKILRGEIPAISNLEKQVIESAAGYDGIIALIQTKGISPMIILEQCEFGEFSIQPGGFIRTSQSIWVMMKVPNDDSRQKIQEECFNMMKKIIKVFVNHNKDEQLKEWEWDRIPWGIRNGAANFTGYEFTMSFSEDHELSYNG